jgi:uncharacterized membrane protein
MYINENKKGVELVWWTVMAIIIAIIVLLIFVYFIRSGSLQIEGLTDKIFGAPEHFANTT